MPGLAPSPTPSRQASKRPKSSEDSEESLSTQGRPGDGLGSRTESGSSSHLVPCRSVPPGCTLPWLAGPLPGPEAWLQLVKVPWGEPQTNQIRISGVGPQPG